MIKFIIITMYIIMKAFDAFVEYLNSSYLRKELPENVRDVYNQEEYEKYVSYEKENSKIDTVENIVEIVIQITLLWINAYAWLFDKLSGFNMYLQYLIFILGFSLVTVVISTPFSYYRTFVIEEKFGMNETTKNTFVLDKIKGYFVSTILGYLIMILIMFCFENFGMTGIIYITLALLVFLLVINALIIPFMRIFNKFEPLEEGELRKKLLELCDKYGVRVKKIVIRDASRRTTKANAFCSGIRQKTISLDDNLVDNYSTEEIVAVFAHEFAHAKFKHVIKSFPLSMLSIVIVVCALGVVLCFPSLFEAFGFTSPNYYFAEMLISILSWPLSIILNLIANYFSRKHEYEADAFAAREGYGTGLISSLKRLSKDSLSGINPHPLMVTLNYSHPTLSQRITEIGNNMH